MVKLNGERLKKALRKIKGFKSEEEEKLFKEEYKKALEEGKKESDIKRIEFVKKMAQKKARRKLLPLSKKFDVSKLVPDEFKSSPTGQKRKFSPPKFDDNFLKDFVGVPPSPQPTKKKSPQKKQRSLTELSEDDKAILFG